MTARGTARGFTLIELAVVVAVAGLLLGAVLVPLRTQIELSRVKATRTQLENIKDAINGFAIANGRLPCPDTDGPGAAGYGQENFAGAACSSLEGEPPWTVLGVAAFDSWGNRFIYRVSGDFADTNDGTTGAGCSPTAGVSFELCANGNITVSTATNCIINPGTGNTCTTYNPIQNLPAVILSRGVNGSLGPASPDEIENTDSDTNFVARSISNDPNVYFDDIVAWIAPNVLKLRMVQASRLP